MNCRLILFFILNTLPACIPAQIGEVSGIVYAEGIPQGFATLKIQGVKAGAVSDLDGRFTIKNLPFGKHSLLITSNYSDYDTVLVELNNVNSPLKLTIHRKVKSQDLDEVVVSGTLKAVKKLDSPVPVEVYNTCFFRSNPTPSVFEALQTVNGVRPQMNCNICNTGDIHINGLEGPYTMVVIDGMPVVSGLSTVYGLSGIPQSLVERIEIVKGPASTLYGSEAVGGLINVITKDVKKASLLSLDHFTTTWGEVNNDIGLKYKVSQKVSGLMGINYFNYQIPLDKNNDGFTDITLSERISIFNKLSIKRENNKIFHLAGRYVYEDRWGGQTNWTNDQRGGDSIYAESIYTNRWEAYGSYELPVKEKFFFQFSSNGHQQNSYYGTTPFFATQTVLFAQLLWTKTIGRNNLLAGASSRYTHYDDNTSATGGGEDQTLNAPSKIHLPGVFFQNDWMINENNRILLGVRLDHNSLHGLIFTPRINYKLNSQNKKNILRISLGNGYRVANVFSEDHAALTGARDVIFKESLSPETSYNANINFVKQVRTKKNHFMTFDATAFYTYFTNKIIPDYETHVNQIIYQNLNGHAVSQGISANIDFQLGKNWSINAGGTAMSVTSIEDGIKKIQLLTERFSGVWRIQYTIPTWKLVVDYTGNVYGPMHLPLLGPLDNRDKLSPTYSIQNIQLTKKFKNSLEIYGGVKNLLNFRPAANSIARAFDPFDKLVDFDANGQAIVTSSNPNALTFDPSYVYTSNQGIRGFLGFRFTFK